MIPDFLLLNLSKDELFQSAAAGDASCAGRLIEFAAKYNLHGDIFKAYTAYLLICEENAYSLQCERGKAPGKSLEEAALSDAEKLFGLFNGFDISRIYPALACWRGESSADAYFAEAGEVISSFVKKLSAAKNAKEFLRACKNHYISHGAGACALNHAFRLVENSDETEPIILGRMKRMSDLVGLETQKAALMENTRAFVDGRGGVHTGLWGYVLARDVKALFWAALAAVAAGLVLVGCCLRRGKS